MSGGKKKKKYQKRTYTYGEVRKAIKQCSDDTVAKTMLLCVVAARDMFDLDDDGVVKFIDTMTRYVDYEKNGLINMDDASKALKERTGIDLRLRRW